MQLQKIQNRRRIFLQQLFAQRVIAGLYDFLQVLHHAFANSRQCVELFRILDQLLDGFRQAVNEFSGFLIAAVPADNRPVNFQQLCRLPQDSCDLFVVHGGKNYKPERRSKGRKRKLSGSAAAQVAWHAAHYATSDSLRHKVFSFTSFISLTFFSSPNKKGRQGGAPRRPNHCLPLHSAAFETLAACGPFGPCTISKSTGSPSCKVRYPSPVIAE